MDISIERLDELFSLWCSETIFPDSQEWRNDLSETESRIVAIWELKSYILLSHLIERFMAKDV